MPCPCKGPYLPCFISSFFYLLEIAKERVKAWHFALRDLGAGVDAAAVERAFRAGGQNVHAVPVVGYPALGLLCDDRSDVRMS